MFSGDNRVAAGEICVRLALCRLEKRAGSAGQKVMLLTHKSANVMRTTLLVVAVVLIILFTRQLFVALGLSVLLLIVGCGGRGVTPNTTRASRFCNAGAAVLAACVIAFVMTLSGSPTAAVFRKQEPSPSRPVLPLKASPAELLSQRWSTADKNAAWPVAQVMFDMSRIAYMEPAEGSKRIRACGFDPIFFKARSMEAYLAIAGKNAVVAFRGTELGTADVIYDLKVISTGGGSGRFHAGFKDGFEVLRPALLRELEERRISTVWLTGHSLGGALAVVAACYLIDEGGYEIGGVMTFGQPMVIRHQLAELYDPILRHRYVAFVNGSDPIARSVMPFVHFGHMVLLDNGDVLRADANKRRYGAGPDAAQSTRLITPMSQREVASLIEQLEQADEPRADDSGVRTYQGQLIGLQDHYLDAYAAMIRHLLGSPGVAE